MVLSKDDPACAISALMTYHNFTASLRPVSVKTARELGMNKSSHWYQRKMLKERGSLRLYNNTKHYFV